MKPPGTSSQRDYRLSHLQKGADYDLTLSQNSFQSYIHRVEAELLEQLIPPLFEGRPRRCLDFACGTGRVTSLLERFSDAVLAVDVSESMVSQARQKCRRTTFHVQDITVEPLRVEPCQVVTAFRFLGNAEPSLRQAALAAIQGLVADRGYLVVNNHRNPRSLHNTLRRWQGDEIEEDLDHGSLRRLLFDAGFTIVRRYGIGLWFIRSRFDRAAICQSRIVAALEPLSRLPGAAVVCPDAIVVAQKIAGDLGRSRARAASSRPEVGG